VGERLRFDVSPTLPSRPSRRCLTVDCEREWGRDAQVVVPALILFSWTAQTPIFLLPPATSHHQPPELPSHQPSVRSDNDDRTSAFIDIQHLANAFARRLHALFPSTQGSSASAIPNDSAPSSQRRESLPPRFLKVRIVTWNMHDSLPKVSNGLVLNWHS
jgi:hypothetical protein